MVLSNATTRTSRSWFPIATAIILLLLVHILLLSPSTTETIDMQEPIYHLHHNDPIVESRVTNSDNRKPNEPAPINPSEGLLHANVSIILTVFNQEAIIGSIIQSILTLTLGPYELIVVFDSCTDKSKEIVDKAIESFLSDRKNVSEQYLNTHQGMIAYKPLIGTDLYETKANNLGMKSATGNYWIICQDDMVMIDFGWDRYLVQAFATYDDMIAVSARCTHDDNLDLGKNEVVWSNLLGHCGNHNFIVAKHERYLLWVADVAIRGPLMIDGAKMKTMNYLDEEFAPLELDDHDLCLRAYESHRWRCGMTPVGIFSDPDWSHRRSSPNPKLKNAHENNVIKLRDRHQDFFMKKPQKTGILRYLDPRDDVVSTKTIVTAANANHFSSLLELLKSVMIFEPLVRLVVFNLGFEQNQLKKLHLHFPNVVIKTFNFSLYPEFVNIAINRGEYAWKPIILSLIASEYGGLVLWMDGGNIVLRSLDYTWEKIKVEGVYSTCTSGNVAQWTHPKVLDYFGQSTNQSLLDAPNFNGALIGFNSANMKSMSRVLDPWWRCALIRECIAPIGSNRLNHRQDQAVLGLLMNLEGYHCDATNGQWANPLPLDMDVTIQQDLGGSDTSCVIDGKVVEQC